MSDDHHEGGATPLPGVIDRYFAAHDRRDTDNALATFTPAGRVHDDGHEYVGSVEIREWIGRASTQFTYTRTFVDASPTGPNAWMVVNRLKGNFPGGEVDLRYRFVLDGDAIAELVIAP